MSKIIVRDLPEVAVRLCDELNAPPRLRAHLRLVYDAAVRLCDRLDKAFPNLDYDRNAVLPGAATHDLGKILHSSELSAPGANHERDGPPLLERHGLSASQARFAGTHGARSLSEDATLEDMLVALADSGWKGARRDELEKRISSELAQSINVEPWEAFMVLDDELQKLGQSAKERLAWQFEHPC